MAMNIFKDQPLSIVLIFVLLIIIGIVTYCAAVKGRIKSMPEEVTKGIKSETPFPSISSKNSSVYPNNSGGGSRISRTSRGSSSNDIINEPILPSDFVINESTYIVKKEFIPKKVDELPVKRNQVLSVKEIYEDGWCMAISVTTGEMGVVPFECLEKYTDILKNRRAYQQQLQYQQQQQLQQQQLQQQQQIQIDINPYQQQIELQQYQQQQQQKQQKQKKQQSKLEETPEHEVLYNILL